MPRPKNPIPKPRRHSSGRARVTIDGKDYLLGPFGSPKAEEAYKRLIAQWLAREGPFLPRATTASLTVAELLAGYWKFAEKYYGYDVDPKRGDCFTLKETLQVVRNLYSRTMACDFGPKDLRAVQGEMISRGWSRGFVNSQVGRVKRMFKWAVAEELISPTVWQALLALPGLRRGKTDARESEPVRPVPQADIDAARNHARPAIIAMIDFMMLTACRPNEVCQLRPCDIDRTGDVWTFTPARHKTQHHGHARPILIGPRGQAMLAPWLAKCEAPDSWVFSPRREEEERQQARTAARASKETPSQAARRQAARIRRRKRSPHDRYTTSSFRRAVHRACEAAGVAPWGVNRLRHNRATELRIHGLDVVGTILGHQKLETTQIYSERNMEAAKELVGKVG